MATKKTSSTCVPSTEEPNVAFNAAHSALKLYNYSRTIEICLKYMNPDWQSQNDNFEIKMVYLLAQARFGMAEEKLFKFLANRDDGDLSAQDRNCDEFEFILAIYRTCAIEAADCFLKTQQLKILTNDETSLKRVLFIAFHRLIGWEASIGKRNFDGLRKNLNVCALCYKHANLSKSRSHVIADSFYRFLINKIGDGKMKEALIKIYGTSASFAGPSQLKWPMLCSLCDSELIGTYCEVPFLNGIGKPYLESPGNIFDIPTKPWLYLFAISLVWRAFMILDPGMPTVLLHNFFPNAEKIRSLLLQCPKLSQQDMKDIGELPNVFFFVDRDKEKVTCRLDVHSGFDGYPNF